MTMKIRQADPAEHGTFYREVELQRGTLDEEARTVQATLSTESPVERFFGTEVLEHTPKTIDLARAKRGLPLLFSHDQQTPIGRVEGVELQGDRLEGRLRFSRNTRAEEIWQDVREGMLSDVSIGYRVRQWADVDGGRRAKRWELLEASVVAVPADPGAQIHREEPAMDPTPNVPAPDAGSSDAARRSDIIESYRAFPAHAALMFECIDNPTVSPEMARARLLAKLGEGAEPVGSIQAGDDQRDKTVEALDRALAVKLEHKPHPETRLNDSNQRLAESLIARHDEAARDIHSNPLSGMTFLELAREHAVRVAGIPEARNWSTAQVADKLFQSRAMGGLIGHHPDDFTNLLANNIGKSLQVGYVEAPETWQQWCRVGSLQDFKTANRPVMSTFGDLDDITDDKEYKYGTFSDRQETIVLKTFGKLFSISRTAIINDDQNAFSDIPRHMGRAAARMVGDEVYSILTTNANLSDAVALFAAGHSNLTDSGTAPTVAALNSAYTLMATQTDPAGNTLNLLARYIIIPAALWGTTRTLLTSSLTPGGSNNDNNIWQASLEQVTEPRLDADSAVKWYLAASPMAVGTVEVGFLNGQQSPYLEQQDGFTRDGAIYKVRLDVGAAPLDHRGLYQNDGEA